MVKKPHFVLVLDVGKTNVKIHILDERQQSVETFVKSNKPVNCGPYPHSDVEGIWQWLVESIQSFAARDEIGAIAVSTHGATAALIDSSASGQGLVLPVMDYEWPGVESVNALYEGARPPFGETCSPALPGGLNLGRQLLWQQQNMRDDFNRADALLMYPQYWTWRLTGSLVSEVSSLGCHTDLWSPTGKTFSSLVTSQGWESLFPPLASAWSVAGLVSDSVAAEIGLPASCRVHVGVHDSNASMLRFLLAKPGEDFCVVSSGTWVICMSTGNLHDAPDPAKDMLANVDVQGNPVPCVRFMGGREYAEICELTGCTPGDQVNHQDIEDIVSGKVMALPDFSGGSGPFGGREPEIRGKPLNGAALATVYCALMVDYCLGLLKVEGDVIVVGSFVQNPLLCSMISQLRDQQPVYVSSDQAGTVRGAAQLANWSVPVSVAMKRRDPTHVNGLEEYRCRWYEQIEGSP